MPCRKDTKDTYHQNQKKVVSDQKHNQGRVEKDVDGTVDTTRKTIRIFTCAIHDDMPKIKSKHLVFKSSINGIKTCLLIDNSSETKLIDKSFVRTNKISTFELKKAIKLTLSNGKVVQMLTRECLVDVKISNYRKQILCYLAKLNVYTVILGNRWL